MQLFDFIILKSIYDLNLDHVNANKTKLATILNIEQCNFDNSWKRSRGEYIRTIIVGGHYRGFWVALPRKIF